MAFKEIEWQNDVTDLNEDTMKEFQTNIKNAIDDIESKAEKAPIGTGYDYYGETAPEGYLFADGSAISRTEYSELFATIGTKYGAGDGSTTFNLPDKREAVTAMKSENQILGTIVGTNSYKLTNEDLPEISGSFEIWAGIVSNSQTSFLFSGATGCFNKNTTNNSGCYIAAPVGEGRTNNSIEFNIGGKSDLDMRQKTLICNYIIKVK